MLHVAGQLFARWRIRVTRLNGYLFILTFPATIMTVIKVYNVSLWWGLLVIPIIVIVLVFDDRIGMRGEHNFANDRNPALQEILEYIRKQAKNDV